MMATMFDCVQSAFDQGAIGQSQAQRYQQDFQDLSDRYARTMPRAAADAAAAEDLKQAARKSLTTRRHVVLNQLATMRANADRIAASEDPSKSLMHALNPVEGFRDGGESVESLRRGLAREFHGMIGDFLAATSRDLVGRVRDKALVKDIVRELHGQASNSPRAKAMADGIRNAQERARTLFNAHGGDIGKLNDYGVQHSHDLVKIRNAGFQSWADEITERLDWDRIEDKATSRPFAVNGQLVDPAAARSFLRDVYDGITTRDWDTRAPKMSGGGQALYNRRGEARILHFKNADEWLTYNDAFGHANPFDAIVSTFEGYARDIALMRVLGPNPKLGLEHLIQSAQKRVQNDPSLDAAARGKAEDAIAARANRAKAMLAHITGSANVPASRAWASFYAGTRQVLTSAQLGGAILSSVTDLHTVRLASKSVGMSPNNVMARQAQLLASAATRQTAAQMGYVADTLADAGSAAARFLGDVWSPQITQTLSSFVMRASGLAHWTDMTRTAFLMEFSGYLAENAGRRLRDVDPLLRDLLVSRGFSAEDWDKLRTPGAMFTAPNGAKFISPMHWREVSGLPRAEAEGLALRLSAMMEEQLEFAVPSVNIEARTALIGDAAPGTFAGELLRSTAMYKNFALSLTLNQYRRIMAQPTGMSRARYAASLVAGMTILGGVAVQLKELAKGRDPRPMDTPVFWAAAMFQGGGLGIFGDFFHSETSRAGGGIAETLAGPVAGFGGDALRMVSSNTQRVLEGREPLLGRDVVNMARRYTPGTSLWQIRTALDRLVWDQLQVFLDPEAERQFRRQMSRQRNRAGNDYWWDEGETAPDRGPSLSEVF